MRPKAAMAKTSHVLFTSEDVGEAQTTSRRRRPGGDGPRPILRDTCPKRRNVGPRQPFASEDRKRRLRRIPDEGWDSSSCADRRRDEWSGHDPAFRGGSILFVRGKAGRWPSSLVQEKGGIRRHGIWRKTGGTYAPPPYFRLSRRFRGSGALPRFVRPFPRGGGGPSTPPSRTVLHRSKPGLPSHRGRSTDGPPLGWGGRRARHVPSCPYLSLSLPLLGPGPATTEIRLTRRSPIHVLLCAPCKCRDGSGG